MKNNVTEIVFILDRSGSMAGLESDTVGGFNSTVEQQKKKPGTAYVSTVLFDHEVNVLHDRVPLDQIRPMTEDDYQVGGCTALLDALGGAIHHIGNVHKYARPEDVPEHTVFVVTTDGLENASHRYDWATVKKQIERQQKKYGWEFIFLAADIDAVQTAGNLGIQADRAVNYRKDRKGVGDSYDAMSQAISAVRMSQPLSASDWRKKLDEER